MIAHLRRPVLALAVLAVLPFASAAGAADRTFVVTSTADAVDAAPGNGTCEADVGAGLANVCTLRAAVQEANALGGSTRIALAAGATYLLTIAGAGEDGGATGDLDVDAPLVEIAGPPKGALPILDGGQLDRVLDAASGSSLTLSRLVVRGGAAPADEGGGVRMSSLETAALLTLDQVEISGNTAALGGGVLMRGGVVLDSRIVGNTAVFGGGGLVIFDRALVLRSTIAGNAALEGGFGGAGLYVSSFAAVVAVENSTIAENVASFTSQGGTILLASGQLHLRNVTVAGNFASNAAAIVDLSGSAVGLWNSVVVHTVALPPYSGCAGDVVLHGFNLLDRAAADCPVTFAGDSQGEQLGVAAELGTLGDHGGFGSTFDLLAGSPAIDRGDPNGCRDDAGALLATDQRGAPRPRPGATGGPLRCDVGAYEFDFRVFTDGFESGDLSAWSSAVP